jgi:hypothetical protein
MKLIDANQYRKEFLDSRDFEPMKILDLQPTINAIPIPEGATNGDIIKILFPNGKEYDTINDGCIRYEIEIDFDYSYCSYFDEVWWNEPYIIERKE